MATSSPPFLRSRTETAPAGCDEYDPIRLRASFAAGLSFLLGLHAAASPVIYPLFFRAVVRRYPPLPVLYAFLVGIPASALLGLLIALPAARRRSRFALVAAGLNFLVLVCCLVAMLMSVG